MNRNLMKLVKEHLDQRIEQDLQDRHVGCVVIDTWPAVFLSSLLEELLEETPAVEMTVEDFIHGA